MGFYEPQNNDEIGKSQFEVMRATEAQVEMALKREVEREGHAYKNRFVKPEGMSERLQGYWEAMSDVHHSLGGVHIGVLNGIQSRARDSAVQDHADGSAT